MKGILGIHLSASGTLCTVSTICFYSIHISFQPLTLMYHRGCAIDTNCTNCLLRSHQIMCLPFYPESERVHNDDLINASPYGFLYCA